MRNNKDAWELKKNAKEKKKMHEEEIKKKRNAKGSSVMESL